MEELNAKVINLAGFIDYQALAVVSKTLMNKKTGSMTLFAFDKGQELSEHTTPYDAMVYVLDGEVEVVIGGESMRVAESEMVIMPADVPHALNAVEKFKMLLVMIKE